MSKTPKMGRGLDALWGQSEGPETKHDSTILAIHKLVPNPNQPRRQFDEEALTELASSIEQHGILQPILVRPKAHNKNYEIVAGERRWRAAKKAGLNEVPVFIKEMTDEEVMAAALIENIQREDLTPIEEALALHSLRQECGITQEELATRLGKSRSALANTLRLLQLTPNMQAAVNEGVIQAGHARTLLSLDNGSEAQEELFKAIVEQGLSVRDAEAAVNYIKQHASFPWQTEHHDESENQEQASVTAEENTLIEENKPSPKKGASRTKSPYLKGLQDRMKERMLVKTAISGNEQRGRITLTYTNAEELTQILLSMGIHDEKLDDDTFPVKQ